MNASSVFGLGSQPSFEEIEAFLNRLSFQFPHQPSDSEKINPLRVLAPVISSPLVGRNAAFEQALSHINSYSSSTSISHPHGYPCFIFTGSPGCGKTRMLFEIAMMSMIKNGQEAEVRQFLTHATHCDSFSSAIIKNAQEESNKFNDQPYVVAISFNGVMTMTREESSLIESFGLNFPLCLRLIYVMKFGFVDWPAFLTAAISIVRLNRNIGFMSIKSLSDHLFRTLPPTLLLIDELLKPLIHGASEFHIISLMSTILQMVDDRQSSISCVLFSAMYDSIIEPTITTSKREFKKCILSFLDNDSMKIIFDSIYNRCDKFRQAIIQLSNSNSVSKQAVISYLIHISGGLPRSVDYIIEAVYEIFDRTTDRNLSFGHVYKMAAQKQSQNVVTNMELLKIVFLKYQVQPQDKIGSCTITVNDLANRGMFHVKKTISDAIGNIADIIPQFPELSIAGYAFVEPDVDIFGADLRTCLTEFFHLRLHSSNNVWEEITRRRELLARHLRNSDQFSSIHPFQLFSPCLVCKNCDSMLRVNGRIVLNSAIMKYVSVPSPDFAEKKDAHEYLWSPADSFESGIDWMMFLPKGGDCGYTVLGVQNKWIHGSVSEYELTKAYSNFIVKMTDAGWDEGDLFLIFLIKGNISQSLSNVTERNKFPGIDVGLCLQSSGQWKNVAVVSDDDERLLKVLGLTVYSFAESVQVTSQNYGLQMFMPNEDGIERKSRNQLGNEAKNFRRERGLEVQLKQRSNKNELSPSTIMALLIVLVGAFYFFLKKV